MNQNRKGVSPTIRDTPFPLRACMLMVVMFDIKINVIRGIAFFVAQVINLTGKNVAKCEFSNVNQHFLNSVAYS